MATGETPVEPAVPPPESIKSEGTRCRFCSSPYFRRSPLRLGDFFTLLTLRYPVRCARCGQAQKISLLPAMKAAKPLIREEKNPITSPTPQMLHDLELQRQGLEPITTRAAIPQTLLKDPLDIRCQYCPGQAFRRTKFRSRDLLAIFRMHYTVRCLRCGQRQETNFMVAAVAMASSFKQARANRNSLSWKDFTQGTDVPLSASATAGIPPASEIPSSYQLKDSPAPAPTPKYDVTSQEFFIKGHPGPALEVPKPAKTVAPAIPRPEPAPTHTPPKKPSDDHSIW